VTIDEHGPLDRAKDVSFGSRISMNPKCPRIFGDGPTTFPSSAPREHPLSSVRSFIQEETWLIEVDRPRSSFRRHPAKSVDFQRTGCFPPPRFTVAPGIASQSYPRRPPAHAAHTFSPGWGEVHFGPCKHSVRDKPARSIESADAFFTRWIARAWD